MKNLVLVTSMINTSTNPLSYTSVRSIFTGEQRFEQTKKTLSTIKEKIPDCKIILVECSQLTAEQEQYIKENTDWFLNFYENESVRNDCQGLSKALSEGSQTIQALDFIQKQNIEYDNLFKISGRYWLNDDFDYHKYDNSNINIYYIEGRRDNVLTAIYKIPKSIVSDLFNFLQRNIQQMRNCIGYEVLMAQFYNTHNYPFIQDLKPMGLSGYVAVCGSFYQN